MTTAHLNTIAANQHQQDLLTVAAESRRAAVRTRSQRSERPRRRRFAFPRRRPAVA